MKPENRKKLNLAVGLLKEMNIEPKDILLVGSLALDLQGLYPGDRPAHDVDLIVKMSSEKWMCLKLLEKGLNRNNFDMYPVDDNVLLDLKGIVLNIWRANGKENISGLKDDITGVWVKPAGEIIAKKKSYGRNKDLNDLNKICCKILG